MSHNTLFTDYTVFQQCVMMHHSGLKFKAAVCCVSTVCLEAAGMSAMSWEPATTSYSITPLQLWKRDAALRRVVCCHAPAAAYEMSRAVVDGATGARQNSTRRRLSCPVTDMCETLRRTDKTILMCICVYVRYKVARELALFSF